MLDAKFEHKCEQQNSVQFIEEIFQEKDRENVRNVEIIMCVKNVWQECGMVLSVSRKFLTRSNSARAACKFENVWNSLLLE